MDTQRIVDLTKKLDQARKELNAAIDEAALLNLSGHQEIINVSIGNKSSRSFSLSTLDRSYRAVSIRGTEMVMLGVKKLYQSRVDSLKEHVAEIEARIRQETGA